MTDDHLRRLARELFHPDEAEPDPEPTAPRSNSVPSEGSNPGAGLTDEDYRRDFARRLFDPGYAATEPELAEENQP